MSTKSIALYLGIRLEWYTLGYMTLEAALSIAAAIAGHSVLIAAFGFDSIIELISGGILLWRLQIEAAAGDFDRVEKAEGRASRFTAVTFLLLCIYVLISSLYGLLNHIQAESSLLGIGVSLAAFKARPLQCDG